MASSPFFMHPRLQAGKGGPILEGEHHGCIGENGIGSREDKGVSVADPTSDQDEVH
jgi:hypothetical protein